MKLKVIGGIAAIIGVIVLEFLPMELAILVYGIIGATLGAFFRKINNWARDGLVSVVGGAVIAILVDQVLPSLIESSIKDLTGVSVFLVKSIPYILKAGIIWGAFIGIMEKLGKISWE